MKTLTAFLLLSLAVQSQQMLKPGIYRGVLQLHHEVAELPFNFKVSGGKKPDITIYNAEETIQITEVLRKGDSLIIKHPVFDTEFRTRINGNSLKGIWINNYRKSQNRIPFTASLGETRRFLTADTSNYINVEGKWQCVFSPGTEAESPAIGIFHHIEQTANVRGTFLTETGDYRFLEGITTKDSLMLSAFDGSHVFLFKAALSDDSLKGMFWSGSHWQETWTAKRNGLFSLRDPEQITSLADSTQKISFAFKNLRGKTVTLNDKKYYNKPVILQLMGSWCPNCMDESRYLADLYKQKKSKGLEIVALAFEKTNDEETNRKRLRKLKENIGIDYEILLTGAVGKDEASKTLPYLSRVTAFPTTIFLNRAHKIVKIHTGFNGPATGKLFDEFKTETESLIDSLLRK